MKKTLFLLSLCLVCLLPVKAQLMYRYVIISDEYDWTQAERSYIEERWRKIGVTPINIKQYLTDLRINPYDVCELTGAGINLMSGWYMMKLECSYGSKILYDEGSPRKFFRSYSTYLQRTQHDLPAWERTEFTTEVKLKEHWEQTGLTQKEGIYRILSTVGGLKIGVVKIDNQYKIIVLENYAVWKIGEVIGTIEGDISAVFGVDWASPAKNGTFSGLGYIDNNMLHIDLKEERPSPEWEFQFLKIYPTSENEITETRSVTVAKKSGSGIVLTKNGIIATNYHVIENTSKITVQINKNGSKQSYKAKVLIADKINDLCLLQIDDGTFADYPDLQYGFRTDICETGTSVFAMGYPMSDVLGEEVKVTDGLISSKTGFDGNIVMYQISVPIQPGNSGGPLFDKQGYLVGITNAGVQKAQNVGYAIKSSYLKNLIDAAPGQIKLPDHSAIENLPFTQQIQKLSQYIVWIIAE